MIVHPPEIAYKHDQITYFARIETKRVVPGFPQQLWFLFSDKWGTYLAERTDAFALGMLPFAMLFNEPLVVKGTTSSLLAYGLQEYKAIFHLWFPKLLNNIDIDFEKVQGKSTTTLYNSTAVGASFSGGVDSMFTLWHHLPQNAIDKEAQITHLVHIYGQNSDYQKRDTLRVVNLNLHNLVEQLNLEFIEVSTNLRDFLPWLSIMLIYQASLIGVPLALGEFFRRYYVPSDGYTGAKLAKRGSSPVLDHFASTETMTVIHHGWPYSRIEKLKLIADWDMARNNLRVCDDPRAPLQSYNCCSCEKCIHTMNIILAISDLSKFPTFKPSIPLINYINWGLHYEFETRNISDPQRAFIQQKKFKYLPLLWLTAFIAYLKMIVSALLPQPFKTLLKKLIYPYLRQK